MTTTLSAVDQYGRQVGQAEFQRTWRYNDATDKRVYGWKLLRSYGCDFGSLRFFFVLPTERYATAHGLEPGLTWEANGQTFCM